MDGHSSSFDSIESSNGEIPCSPFSRESRKKVVLPKPFLPPSLVNVWRRPNDPTSVSSLPRQLPPEWNTPQVPPLAAVETIDNKDLRTPDDWIPRDERLVRLTGNHPFNCEVKLKELYNQGFFTPTRLFFVRSHGSVPKVTPEIAECWKLEITGLCSNPITLTLKDLTRIFQVVTIPVTLVCAGNRRKEQNVVQKSLGFNWGAAGVSTALFTGVYLTDILELVSPMKNARHVIFEGSDNLPNGPYGTSQRLSWARDRNRGMLVSWAMNGLPLEPDHGFPLRVVVPGQMAGRSVKWLRKIELSENESQHYMHFFDNRVLPTPVGPDQARKEKEWWYDPKYIITELNVNSAIACPDHDEVLECSNKSSDDTYAIKGYAYAGGGRRVTRVEVSFDEGDSWSLAEITYPEDSFRSVALSDAVYGRLDLTESDTCFCWCFWSFEVTINELKKSGAITVRAMDESLALQPRDMYWNATGMMNNWWFRVCIHHLKGDTIKFEHPTMAGTQSGGWMQRLKDQGLDPAKPIFSKINSIPSAQSSLKAQIPPVIMTNPGTTRKITPEELSLHRSTEQPWFVVDGEVYDATSYLNEHPGGPDSIIIVAGEDASEDFHAIHSSDAKTQMAQFHIGTLIGGIAKVEEASQPQSNHHDESIFLFPNKWKKVRLRSVRDVSSDSKVFRFELDKPDQVFGLPVGQYVYVRLKRSISCGGKEEETRVVESEMEIIQRAYTPISRWEEKGWVDFLIKVYYPCTAFPAGGKTSLALSRLSAYEEVELKGPIGHFIWKGQSIACVHGEERKVREMGLVCGGSGVTAILELAREILVDSSNSETKVWMLDSNRTEEDILCREELDRLGQEYNDRCRIHHTLTRQSNREGWAYSKGRIDEVMIDSHLPSPGPHNLVGISGPKPMEQRIKGILQEKGWNSKEIIVF